MKVTGYMFRLAKKPASGQLQSLNQVHNRVSVPLNIQGKILVVLNGHLNKILSYSNTAAR
jgi:hypothetical protein